MLAFYMSIAATVVVVVWVLAFAGREPSTGTRPPWRDGSSFRVGPALDGSHARPQHHQAGR
jgi:hypothetical protein